MSCQKCPQGALNETTEKTIMTRVKILCPVRSVPINVIKGVLNETTERTVMTRV